MTHACEPRAGLTYRLANQDQGLSGFNFICCWYIQPNLYSGSFIASLIAMEGPKKLTVFCLHHLLCRTPQQWNFWNCSFIFSVSSSSPPPPSFSPLCFKVILMKSESELHKKIKTNIPVYGSACPWLNSFKDTPAQTRHEQNENKLKVEWSVNAAICKWSSVYKEV